MRIKLVDLEKQTMAIQNEVWPRIRELVRNSDFIGGKHLIPFEQAFASYIGSPFFSGVANGTTALEIALRAAGIKPQDEVITVSHTFFATVEAILNLGAKPIFVDVDEKSGLMDTELVGELITSNTKAILPVHLYGHPVQMDTLLDLCREFDLKLIEDTSQAHGATYKGKAVGTFGDFGTFSFYPGKNLGAWGDAGGISTGNETNYSLVNKLRDHGRLSKYEHDIIGTNGRMDPIQSIVLEEKIKHLSNWNSRRKDIAKRYEDSLQTKGIKVVKPLDSSGSVWHLFVVEISNRDEAQKALQERGIETGIHYPLPLHLQPALRESYSKLTLPKTEKLSKRIISLPIHGLMEDNEVEYVISNFLEVATS